MKTNKSLIRIISLVLITVVLFSLFPLSALAAIKDLSGNSDEENNAILAQLAALAGDDSQAAYDLLKSLGLLDENGELKRSYSINLDGVSMSLDEVMTMLEDPGTDLSRVAYVDGVPIALGDLKTITKIEQELERIEKLYFSGKTFSGDELDKLDDLLDQIEAGDVDVDMSALAGDRAGLLSAMATLPLAANSIPCININLEYNNHVQFYYRSSAEEYSLRYRLSLMDYDGAGETYSFSWKRIRGLIPDEYFQVKLTMEVDNAGTTNYIDVLEGDTFLFDYDERILGGYLYITCKGDLDDLLGFVWEGPMRGFVEFTGYDGLVFEGNPPNEVSDIYNIPLEIIKPYAFRGVSWTKEISVSNGAFDIENGYDRNYWLERLNRPIWPLNTDRSQRHALSLTSEEMYRHNIKYGEIQRRYEIETDVGFVSEGGASYVPDPFFMLSAMPVGAFNADAYYHAENWKFDVLSYGARVYDEVGGLWTWRSYSADLSSIPLRYQDGSLAHLRISPSRDFVDGWSDTGVSFLNMRLEGPYDTPEILRAFWPQDPVFYNRFTGFDYNLAINNTGQNRLGRYTGSATFRTYTITRGGAIRVPDPGRVPTVESVTIPAGTYKTGQYVPIHIKFSDPVWPTYMVMTINGNEYSGADLQLQPVWTSDFGLVGGGGRDRVVYYKVQDADMTTILISDIKNYNTYWGNTYGDNNGGEGWYFGDKDVVLESALMKDSVTEFSIANAAMLPDDIVTDGKSAIMYLTLKQDAAYRTKYANYNNSKGVAPFMARVTNRSNGNHLDVPFTLEENGGILSAWGEITSGDFLSVVLGFDGVTDTTYKVEVYAYESTDDTTGAVVPGAMGLIHVGAITCVNGLEVIYPVSPGGSRNELSLADSEYTQRLSISFDNSPTFKTGTWVSSNPDIATVGGGANGVWYVYLTGKAVGEVWFTFTADDGGYNDPDGTHIKTCSSDPFTVVAGTTPALVIPTDVNMIVTRKGSPVDVRWSSNEIFFLQGGLELSDFQFKVDLFLGNFNEEELSGKQPVGTYYADSDKNNLTIPAGVLETSSIGGVPAYTVRVSMPHPLVQGETLSAICYIIVNPLPLVPHVGYTGSNLSGSYLYLRDNETAQINWSVDNYEPNVTVGTFKIEQISTVSGSDVVTTIIEQLVSAGSGSYNLAPSGVSGLKDTYMVSLQVKNPSDEGYSSDAFPLYVYSSSALQLEAGGGQKGANLSLLMDNKPKVDGTSGPLPTDTVDIMALREELGLIEYIGVNYNDYKWSQLKDGIKWASSSDIVSVNYRQGGLYENLSRFTMETYLPETKMALSSIKDGTATITATHANTGLSAKAEVEVRTLRQKFYLFQFSPAQTTSLTYTDGKGLLKTVWTNNEGVLALYEPDDINSDVSLKAESGGNIWLGTIFQKNLLSGERDATKLQLYPLNTFKLRQAAKAEIYLKKPDGSPYTGSLTLRGGVYKNDGYCQDAKLLGNVVPGTLLDGKEPQTVTIGPSGKLTVYMDSTQFWSEEKGEQVGAALTALDSIQYIFEITGISGYYPLLVYADGNLAPDDIMHSAENIISMESSAGTESPFISNQMLDYGTSGNRLIEVRYSKGSIGPNSTYPEVKLYSTVLLWGKGLNSGVYKLDTEDEYGYYPKAQESRMITYPFSSIPVVRNTLTMSGATLTSSGWIPAGQERGLRLKLWQDGLMLKDMTASLTVRDLSKVPQMSQSSAVAGILVDLKAAGNSPGNNQMSMNDLIMNEALKILGNLSGPMNSPAFKMVITPGKDNAKFNAFIWTGYNSLGLDDVDYTESGLFVDTKLAEGSLSAAPSLKDSVEMSKGAYDPQKSFDESRANQKKGEADKDYDISGQLEGYFEAQIQYNFDKNKWEVYVLGGGFTAGLGASYKITVNEMIYIVPVTATFELGIKAQLDFKAALRWSQLDGLPWASTVTSNYVNDYLTKLHVNLYLSAFAGLGFDYSVVALKIGVFGGISGDFQGKFLSRTYLADSTKRQLNGQGIQVVGETGVKFVAQVVTISYELVIASVQLGGRVAFGDWGYISDYWDNAGSGILAASMSMQSAGFAPVSYSATLQSREYLEEFARSWDSGSRPAAPSMAITSAAIDIGAASPLDTNSLQSNAYPQSRPLLSDDGALLLYASDNDSSIVTQTRIFASKLNSSGYYPEGTEIPSPTGFEGYGDSNHSLAGDGDFAVAAWVRQNASLPDKGAGQSLSLAEQALLMNGTEIVAAIYDGSSWTSERLTDNALPDLAPVVATNGSQAIVAWRSVYAGDSEKILDFSQQDSILYRIYDGTAWSDAKQLYNGTSGAIRGISAAMLPDGTTAVAYTLDTSGVNNTSDYEIGYTIVDKTGDTSFSATITNDSWLDENPQIISVEFASGDDRFVLGWHSMRDGWSDVRLAAINSDGTLSNSFIDSVSQAVSENGVNMNGNFRFARMDGTTNDLTNLSIIWAESAVEAEGVTDYGILRAVKFMQDGSNMWISAALDVAELPERTLIDCFDAYVAPGDGNTVKAVIQGTEYKEIDPGDSSTFTLYNYTDTNGSVRSVYVPKEEVKLFTATETYKNKVWVDSLMVDYANLQLNTLTPVQFTIFNAGMNAINSVNINIKGEPFSFTGLSLYPNENRELICWYLVGSEIENLDYTLTANFGGGSSDTVTGTVYLDYPDLGISQLTAVSEELGIRTMQLTLYNASEATLAGNKDRSVKLGFYDDALFESIQSVTCNTANVTVDPTEHTLTISDETALGLIDEGAFTMEVSFNIGAYVTKAGLAEIPEAGVRLWANTWIEEGTGVNVAVMPEYYQQNNSVSILFDSPLLSTGRQVSINVEQGLSSGDLTTASIDLHNNSLQNKASGNLIVSLLDSDGNILEQQQYNTVAGSLIALLGEQTGNYNFTFTQSGARVQAIYGDLVIGAGNAGLAALSFEGLPVKLSDFTLNGSGNYTYSIPATTLGSTLVGFVAGNPGASVTINGRPADGNENVTLTNGRGVITIEVTSENGAVKRRYILYIGVSEPSPGTGGGSSYDDGGVYTPPPAAVQKEEPTTEPTLETVVNPFGDVRASDWFFDDVAYVYQKGLMTGTSTSPMLFSPKANLTRGMIVTILYRMEGLGIRDQGLEDEVNDNTTPHSPLLTPNFSDVVADSWYSEAVAWAAENGIVGGYGNGKFGPDDPITRQDLATILMRYMIFKGINPLVAAQWIIFADEADISDYAMDAIQTLNKLGIINGTGTNAKGQIIINPKGNATRAEVAAMLHRFMEKIA